MHAAGGTRLPLLLRVASLWRLFSAEPRWPKRQTVNGKHIPLRSDVMASMRQNVGLEVGRSSEYPAAQVGSLGNTKESTELTERRLGESLREEVGDVHIRRDITHTK